jgi:hypothetical protein
MDRDEIAQSHPLHPAPVLPSLAVVLPMAAIPVRQM